MQVQAEKLIERLDGCPACNSRDLKELSAPEYWIDKEHFAEIKDELRLSKCRHCGLVLTNPRPGSLLLRTFYNKPGYQCHELQYDGPEERYAAARFDILEPFCHKGLLLDYGCGSGNMLKAGLARGWDRVTGIEIGEGARSRLIGQGWEVYPELSAAEGLRAKVDALTMIQVFEHLPVPGEILDRVRTLLSPNGVFVLEVPNAGSLRARIAGSLFAHVLPYPVQRYQAFPIHLYHFQSQQLAKLLRRHGFEIVKLCTVGMGIEELFSKPANHAEPARPALVPQPASASSIPSMPGTHAVKTAIKAAMSRLKLGEQLFVICRRAT